MRPRGFASDNYAGVHPEVLQAIVDANTDHAPAYGADRWTAAARAAIKQHFGEQAEAFPVFNGSGANNLCLASMCRPWEAVICASTAHVNVDESTSPEALARVKLLQVATDDGKLTPELAATRVARVGDEHAAQARVVSITESTELGTVYEPTEIRALADFAHAHDLLLHVDGTRLFNAAAATGASFAELITDTGVDALSLGGTKSGAMGAEVVVFLHPDLAPSAKYLRKHLLQLASKQRYVSAQMTALLTDELGLRNGRHANAMAERLATAVRDLPGVTLTQQPRANQIFAILDPAVTAQLQREWAFYTWDETTGEVRWVTSWDTTADDVDQFAADIAAAVGGR